MEEKEYEVIMLEDNLEYAEIETLNYNNNTYYLLVQTDNPENICIRKLLIENNEEYIVGLDSKEEFDNVINLFSKKLPN